MNLLKTTEYLKSNTGEVFTNYLEQYLALYKKIRSKGRDIIPEESFFLFHFEAECESRNIEL